MPINLNIYNQEAEKIGDIKLSSKVFGLETSESLVHQAVITQMANERQVLAHTKDRSEVRGGGKKPWKQKGTGRARAGSSRSPIWIGGGVTFGPLKNRNFKKKINKKMKQAAVLMVISDKIKNNQIAVLDQFKIDEFKTKLFNKIISNFENKLFVLKKVEKTTAEKKDAVKVEKAKKVKRSILIINDQKDEKVKYSGRNLVGVEIINADNINIVDLVKYKYLIVTKNFVETTNEKNSKK